MGEELEKIKLDGSNKFECFCCGESIESEFYYYDWSTDEAICEKCFNGWGEEKMIEILREAQND